MAAGKEKLHIQIALFIFVLLTIVLSVTTYVYYDKFRTARDEKIAAAKKLTDGEKSKKEALLKVERLKELVGKGKGDPVDDIMNGFARHQVVYGGTLPEDTAKIYPVMLESQADQIRKLQGEIVDYQARLVKQKGGFDQQLADARAELAKLEDGLKSQSADIREVREKFVLDRKAHEDKVTSGLQQVREAQNENLTLQQQSKAQLAEREEQLREKAEQVVGLKNALEPYRNYKSEPPDGKVVRINQSKGTVYIDLGSSDGLRRQTTFSVFPYDVTNALDRTPKGTIEVIRIVGANMAEARVTYDSPSDPIVRDDKIVSAVFRRGQPERFAIAGMIDMTGNDRSDLPQLLALIQRSGGEVDAYVDDAGNRQGVMSPSTKFLIMGARPDEKSDEKVLTGYRKLLDEAQKHGVGTMSLPEFLDYVGWQGKERSVGLGRHADHRDFPVKGANSSPFRRRSTGSTEGKKSAY